VGACFRAVHDERMGVLPLQVWGLRAVQQDVLRRRDQGPPGDLRERVQRRPRHAVPDGWIHPRSKIQVGDRLATAYYNALVGGKGASSGPTLSACSATADSLHIEFNTSMLMGDKLKINPWGQPYTPPVRHASSEGGSYLYVQTNASQFCMEAMAVLNTTSGASIPGLEQCPTWAGGDGKAVSSDTQLDGGWTLLNFTADSAGTGVVVDLSPLNGSAPTAVRYAWDIVQCIDHADPTLYVTHGAVASCPIYSAAANLPATPFKAKIVGGKCECVAPQVCS
jgi:hypothetical protein